MIPDPKTRFTDRAGDYVVGRPTYPAAALDALFEGLGDPHGVRVADLGAGTGISSRLLAARGARVFAIEPNARMRAVAQADERVTWIDGSAEHTGCADASVDLVTAFQSFHWFDHARTLREIVRIVRAGGRAALVANERDESDAFTAEYGTLVRRFQLDDTERRRVEGVEAFVAFDGWRHGARRVAFRHEQVLDVEGVLARARSTSYLPNDGPDASALHAAIRTLVARYERDGRVALALRTTVAIGDVGAGGG